MVDLTSALKSRVFASIPVHSLQTEQLIVALYDELRRLARAYLQRERADHTLQPTALVHEAFLRLADSGTQTWHGKDHFLGAAARAMRQILVHNARYHLRIKRGNGCKPISLDESVLPAARRNDQLLVLDEALNELARLDPRTSRVVELRYFAGLTMKEIAEVLRVTEITVRRDWVSGRVWLNRFLARS